MGSKYVPLLESGKIDVPHTVFPTFASTRIEPNPLFTFIFERILYDISFGTVTNRHAALSPGYTQSFALNFILLNLFINVRYKMPLVSTLKFWQHPIFSGNGVATLY